MFSVSRIMWDKRNSQAGQFTYFTCVLHSLHVLCVISPLNSLDYFLDYFLDYIWITFTISLWTFWCLKVLSEWSFSRRTEISPIWWKISEFVFRLWAKGLERHKVNDDRILMALWSVSLLNAFKCVKYPHTCSFISFNCEGSYFRYVRYELHTPTHTHTHTLWEY